MGRFPAFRGRLSVALFPPAGRPFCEGKDVHRALVAAACQESVLMTMRDGEVSVKHVTYKIRNCNGVQHLIQRRAVTCRVSASDQGNIRDSNRVSVCGMV